jgi:hypothetical protein
LSCGNSQRDHLGSEPEKPLTNKLSAIRALKPPDEHFPEIRLVTVIHSVGENVEGIIRLSHETGKLGHRLHPSFCPDGAP